MDENKKQIMVEKHRWPDEIAKEKKKRKVIVLVVLACVLCFTGGFFVGGGIGGTSNTTSSRTQNLSAIEAEKFQEIYDILLSDWYFGKDVDDLESYVIDHAINGIANENDMDTHTEYMDEKSASALLTSLSGSLTGIGIQYYELNDAILVEKIFIDSPAEKAGMKEGDIIKKVDGVDISKKEIIHCARKQIEIAGTDLVIANDISKENCNFGSDNNEVFLIDENILKIHLSSKKELSKIIFDEISKKI